MAARKVRRANLALFRFRILFFIAHNANRKLAPVQYHCNNIMQTFVENKLIWRSGRFNSQIEFAERAA